MKTTAQVTPVRFLLVDKVLFLVLAHHGAPHPLPRWGRGAANARAPVQAVIILLLAVYRFLVDFHCRVW